MERQSAVKAHDVCASAANIVRALRDIFYDVCAALLQCLHDVRIILRFPCNVCTIQQLSCFHLTAALQTSCDNVFFFVFQIRQHGGSSFVTVCTNIWNCRAMAFCWPPTARRGFPAKNRAGAAYL